jgi:hypothetical protein
MKLSDIKKQEDVLTLIKSKIPKLNQEPEFLYHNDYWDGPINGICMFNNQPCYFGMVKEYFSPYQQRIFAIVCLTKFEWKKEKYRHKMFEKYVGTHTSYTYKNGINHRLLQTEGNLKSAEDMDYFYNVLSKTLEVQNFNDHEIIAWWDQKDVCLFERKKEKGQDYDINNEKQKLMLKLFKNELKDKIYDHKGDKGRLRKAAKSFHEELSKERKNKRCCYAWELGCGFSYENKLQINKYNMRVQHVAYALLKGVPYGKIEGKAQFDNNYFLKRFAKDVYNVYSKYFQKDSGFPELTKDDIENTILKRGDHGKALES